MARSKSNPQSQGQNPAPLGRRSVIGVALGAGVGVPLLSACGSDDSSNASDGGSAGTGGGSESTPSGAVATKADIPVGSGKIFAADKVVITQPTEGDFKAFTAVCTHQGCVVAEVKGAEIDCDCHGSRFSIKDGSVLGGPANAPLTELKVTAEGEDLSVS